MILTDRARDSFADKESVVWVCPQCRAGLLLAPAEVRHRKYCSRVCTVAAQRAGLQPLPAGHTTGAGREKSRQNLVQDGSASAAFWEERATVWMQCLECSELYPSRATRPPLYCSEVCRQRSVRRQKMYMVEKPCAICTTIFTTNKYRPARTCSQSCAGILRHRERKEKEA